MDERYQRDIQSHKLKSKISKILNSEENNHMAKSKDKTHQNKRKMLWLEKKSQTDTLKNNSAQNTT